MTKFQVAETIVAQMGGMGRLKTMVGAHRFQADGNELGFSFKGTSKANYCRVTLLPSDTYRFELLKINRRTFDIKEVYNLDGVYFDMLIDLFESETGLYLSL